MWVGGGIEEHSYSHVCIHDEQNCFVGLTTFSVVITSLKGLAGTYVHISDILDMF